MSRHTDVQHDAAPRLPVVDWSSVGRRAPVPMAVGPTDPNAPLPAADVVVITWTSAEWSALDHVFVNSETERPMAPGDLEHQWQPYTLDAPVVPPDGDYVPAPLWGYYRVVAVDDAAGNPRTVLLFKADAHLAYAPWVGVLVTMIERLIDEAQPGQIYSIGTAGGTHLTDNLGDTAITNSALLRLTNPKNLPFEDNGATFTGSWFPCTDLVAAVEERLLLAMSNVVDDAQLARMLAQLKIKNPDAADLDLDDLVNDPIRPANLHHARAILAEGVPLLTTDDYFIARGDDTQQFCALEMDDAVVAKIATEQNVDFCFVRNLSDPIVPDATATGESIVFSVRKDWSGVIYDDFGLYTSFNGALLTWATIAAHGA